MESKVMGEFQGLVTHYKTYISQYILMYTHLKRTRFFNNTFLYNSENKYVCIYRK